MLILHWSDGTSSGQKGENASHDAGMNLTEFCPFVVLLWQPLKKGTIPKEKEEVVSKLISRLHFKKHI